MPLRPLLPLCLSVAAAMPAIAQRPTAVEPPRSLAEDLKNRGDELDRAIEEQRKILRAQEAERQRQLRIVADTYPAPAGSVPLDEAKDLFVDRAKHRVYVDGYITLDRGPLEMFACPVGTKEHESVIAAFAKSSQVHAALLAAGAQPGSPVEFQPEFRPPTGTTVAVWVAWRDAAGAFQIADARTFLIDSENKAPPVEAFVFAGSGEWTDPEDGRTYYSADSGDMICVSNFTTAMLDVPFASTAENSALAFEANTEAIPPRNTAVRLILVPAIGGVVGEKPGEEVLH